ISRQTHPSRNREDVTGEQEVDDYSGETDRRTPCTVPAPGQPEEGDQDGANVDGTGDDMSGEEQFDVDRLLGRHLWSPFVSFMYCQSRRNPEYAPRTIPVTTSHGSVPSQRSRT